MDIVSKQLVLPTTPHLLRRFNPRSFKIKTGPPRRIFFKLVAPLKRAVFEWAIQNWNRTEVFVSVGVALASGPSLVGFVEGSAALNRHPRYSFDFRRDQDTFGSYVELVGRKMGNEPSLSRTWGHLVKLVDDRGVRGRDRILDGGFELLVSTMEDLRILEEILSEKTTEERRKWKVVLRSL